MASALIWSFVAGILVGYGAPHYINGISGKVYPTLFGKSSPAVLNVVWGWACFVLAALAWHATPMRFHPRAAFVGFSAGFLLIGLALISMWHQTAKSK